MAQGRLDAMGMHHKCMGVAQTKMYGKVNPLMTRSEGDLWSTFGNCSCTHLKLPVSNVLLAFCAQALL